MRILLITQEPPFDPASVATGNALRAAQLTTSLSHAGHDIKQVWLDHPPRETSGNATANQTFQSADQLRSILLQVQPDAILVMVWDLLQMLPYDLGKPVVLDFLAPRPLEILYEKPRELAGELRRLRLALARCDLILVGNTEQEKLLAFWLIEAGFDLRNGSPVRVVPLAADPVASIDRPAVNTGLQLVGGGVHWPWREDAQYQHAISDVVNTFPDQLSLNLSKGAYRWDSAISERTDTNGPQTGAKPLPSASPIRSLQAYADYSQALSQGHIGIELGKVNIERRFSQSFRSLDYLRHGLPLLCNRGLPIAQLIEEYGAGWVVETPRDAAKVLTRLAENPTEWQACHEQTLALLKDRFQPDAAITPLVQWLATPAKAARIPGFGLPPGPEPVLGKPSWRTRLTRKYRLARRVALAKLLAEPEQHENTIKQQDNDPGTVVMVSREDLFPTDHGAAVKVVETARGMSRQGRIILLVTNDRKFYWHFKDGEITRLAYPAWVRASAKPSAWIKLRHYTLDIPESNAFLYLPLSDRSFFWRTLFVARKHHAKAFQAEFPAYALPCIQAAEIVQGSVVLVEHNVEYERLKTQIPELTKAQYDRFKAIEIDLCNRSDAVVCVSDNDRMQLAADGVHPGLLETIPHGIDLEAVDHCEAVNARDQFSIPHDALVLVYHGTYAYPPNRDAIQMLAEEILPRLERLGLQAHVLAVGHQPPPALHPRIHFTGSVDSVAAWLKAADIAVVPLREGGGTRMKIIDDFAAKLPVISTSKGIEGIPARHGVEALICDDWEAFSDAIVTLSNDPSQAERIAQAGRALADSLDWRALGAQYINLHDRLRH